MERELVKNSALELLAKQFEKRRGKTLQFDEDDDDDEAEKEERKGEVPLRRLKIRETLRDWAQHLQRPLWSSTLEEEISVLGVRSNKNPQSETASNEPEEEIDEQLSSSEKKAMSSCKLDGLSNLKITSVSDLSWLIESDIINNPSKLVKKRVQLIGKNGLEALKLASQSGGMANIEGVWVYGQRCCVLYTTSNKKGWSVPQRQPASLKVFQTQMDVLNACAFIIPVHRLLLTAWKVAIAWMETPKFAQFLVSSQELRQYCVLNHQEYLLQQLTPQSP
ncbi:hypothetical protein BY996DRAFT_6536268 [Phakopsora pachyrhizi]|nr:hypothetical protein BY996DRAFT_6536268 [Phakopsora pachyrhizi]